MARAGRPSGPLTFVSVAAYRDPELVPTIADCLARARHPERLRFGISWQHGDEQRLPDWIGGERFRVLDVDWRDSRGTCWARAEIMRLWDGEERYLQLDSHHRFADDWDVKLAEQLERLDTDRALLTAYGASYTPGVADPAPHVTRIGFDHFAPEGAILTRPWIVLDATGAPIPAQFVSAHLLYAPGRFVQDVPYDPELYFIGEESSLAVRAFSHGYDLFHPGVHIAWHEYTRAGRTKHWDDHVPQRVTAPAWSERDAISRAKVRRLLHTPWVGEFGLGTERTLPDYERYAGVSFCERRVLGAEPPPGAGAPQVQTANAPQVQTAGALPGPDAGRTRRRPVRGGGRPSIFIGIAAYRDPDLARTVSDCLARARYPERLRFGIAWQHGPDEQLAAELSGDRFRVLDISWRRSRGTSWARAQAMRLYDGEDWYLQLDSHHRFARGWDETLLGQAALTGSPRPVLSAPAPGFTIGSAPPATEPWRIEIGGFNADGLPVTTLGRLPAAPIPARVAGVVPPRARCVCAHLLFAPGSFVTDVPAEPELYLSGEETVSSLRAFINGYDLYHPPTVVAWHAYDRAHRVAHWQDHTPDRSVARTWVELRRAGLRRYFHLLAEARARSAGFAGPRTLSEYEAYAGISFRYRRIQDYTRSHREPPNPPADPGWPERVRPRRVEIALDAAALPRPAIEDPAFWYVGVHGPDGQELLRQDAPAAELAQLLAGADGPIRLVREFASEATPTTWTVMPHSRSHGWLEPVAGSV